MASERGFSGVDAVQAVSLGRLTGRPRPFELAGAQPRFSPDVPVTWETLTLVVRVDMAARTITGTATYEGQVRAAEVRRLRFDADGIDIPGAHDGDGRSMARESDGKALWLTLNDPVARGDLVRVAIDFQTVDPQAGFYFVQPDADHPQHVPHAWSQGQDEDSKFWFPCHDSPNHKLRLQLLADVPEDMTALSNGILRDIYRGAEPGRRIFDWAMARPLPTYLISLTVGPFVQVIQRHEPVEVSYWVLPGCEAQGERSFGRTPEMIDLYEALTATAYPFEKYAQVAVQEFIFGGMENASMTTQTDRTLHDERAALDFSSEPLVSHELAHQWFGDLLTCRGWHHAWLNEGFATYFELLWRAHTEGQDAFDHARLTYARNYMAEDRGRYRRTVIHRSWDEPIDLFDAHLYEKGAAVLHMLRRKLGDETFFGAVARYLHLHEDGLVETSDLRRTVEDFAGVDLGRFFSQWIEDGTGYPELKVSGRWDGDEGRLCLTVEQTQDPATAPIFHLEAELDIRMADGRRRTETLRVARAREVFWFDLPTPPVVVAFDPRGDLLATLELELPEPMLRTALGAEVPGRARIDAAMALARRPGRANLEVLARSLKGDPSWWVQAEVATALGRMGTRAARDLLLSALDLPHPKARRAVVTALGGFAEPEVAQALQARLAQGDPSYFVEAELARSLGATRQPGLVEVLTTALSRESWNETIRVGVFDGLAALQDPKAIDAVAPYLARRHNLLTRCGAARCLCALYSAPEQAVRALSPWLGDREFRFRLTLAASLANLGHRLAVPLLQQLARPDIEPMVRRRAREGLARLQEDLGPGSEVHQLREQVDVLGRRLRELDDRMGRHEVRTHSDDPAPESALN